MEIADIESTKITDISGITVNSAALSEIIGVSDRRIRGLAEENIIIRAAKGRYSLVPSLKNYILTIKMQSELRNGENADDELDLEKEKAIHEKVKRHISELKLKTMNGELHKSDDVERVMMDMLTSVRTRLLSMPSKLAPLLVSRTDTGYIKETINKEVLEALNELKDYNPKEFYSEDYVDVNDEMDGDDYGTED